MKKQMRRELEKYFKAPKPKGRRDFLKRYGTQKISLGRMLSVQIHYISKWVWVVSVLFFFLAWNMERVLPEKMLGSMLIFIPFLVMISITESMRSVTYGMQELELASRFSLRSIILARMGILGFANLILLAAFAALLGENTKGNVLYLLTPYLFTAMGSLILVRRIRGKEGIFACGGFAAAVSAFWNLFHVDCSFFFQEEYGTYWLLLCAVLLFAVAAESRKTVFCIAEWI